MHCQEAELALGAVLASFPRLKFLDYPASWILDSYGILIPYPKASLKYVAAVAEPLEWQVSLNFKIKLLVSINDLSFYSNARLGWPYSHHWLEFLAPCTDLFDIKIARKIVHQLSARL